MHYQVVPWLHDGAYSGSRKASLALAIVAKSVAYHLPMKRTSGNLDEWVAVKRERSRDLRPLNRKNGNARIYNIRSRCPNKILDPPLKPICLTAA